MICGCAFCYDRRAVLDRRRFLGLAAAAPLPWLAGCRSAPVELFNGQDLSGWEGDERLWLVENGEIVGRSPGISENVFLATNERFEDFRLNLEVRLVDNQGNSGVQFRSEREQGSTEMIGYQADIGPTWWGNLYDESRRRENLAVADAAFMEKLIRKDDWNQYEIRALGPAIRLTINGRRTVEYVETDESVPRTGRIALQIHSGPPLEVRFRNLLLETL